MAKETRGMTDAEPATGLSDFGIAGVSEDVLKAALAKVQLSREEKRQLLIEARKRTITCTRGRVLRISTNNQGVTMVTVGSTDGKPTPKGGKATLETYFYAPGDLTKAQLSELKRAQEADLCVEVCRPNPSNTVVAVNVFECPGQ